MVQLPRERMDPEDREDDQTVDLEEFLAFVTVDSLMELMDTRMWHKRTQRKGVRTHSGAACHEAAWQDGPGDFRRS